MEGASIEYWSVIMYEVLQDYQFVIVILIAITLAFFVLKVIRDALRR